MRRSNLRDKFGHGGIMIVDGKVVNSEEIGCYLMGVENVEAVFQANKSVSQKKQQLFWRYKVSESNGSCLFDVQVSHLNLVTLFARFSILQNSFSLLIKGEREMDE